MTVWLTAETAIGVKHEAAAEKEERAICSTTSCLVELAEADCNAGIPFDDFELILGQRSMNRNL